MKVVKQYETGLPSHYEMIGITFEWDDWVLCEIAFTPNNIKHFCMASSFRSYTNRKGELRVHCTIWNPTYENESQTVELEKLFHFAPIKVITDGRKIF